MLEVRKKRSWRPFAGAVIVISIAAIAGQSVIASLNATAFNDKVQNVNSGTMELKLDGSGNGFSTPIEKIAPNDVVNRYVTLTNSGTLNGVGLSLKTYQTGAPNLITDGATTKALKLTVTSCSIAWDVATGTCNGNPAGGTIEVAPTTIGSLISAKTFLGNSTLAVGEKRYLQMKIELPNQDETTTNGLLPPNTIQASNVNITYTFDLAQRIASPINS